MDRSPFAASGAVAALARVPLLPAAPSPGEPGGSLLAEAVLLASRQASAAGGTARRAVTMRGYELRARWRPTPLGVFAGVAEASFGPGEARLTVGAGHRCRSHPGTAWLAAVADRIVGDPGVLPGLTLHASGLAARRGGLLECELPGTPGGPGPFRSTIRATKATTAILDACADGISYESLLAGVQRRWPQATEGTVAAAVLGMVRSGFLTAGLLPPIPSDDPLGHLAAALPADHGLREPLLRLRALLASADGYTPGSPDRLKALLAARDAADAICFQERPLTVDTAADAVIRLPASLARAAADAAGVLWQACSRPDPLAGWHARFVERYGTRRRVPLLEATDPAAGLGLDLNAGDDEREDDDGREAALALLHHRAVAAGAVEVTLTDADVMALGGPGPGLPPRTAEICVRVIAASAEDRQAGRLAMAVCPGGLAMDAGAAAGRFTSLIPALHTGTDHDPGALVAEVLIAPRSTAAGSLAVRSGLAEASIPVGVAAGPGALPLGGLSLFSDGRRLVVWSEARGCRVIPVLYSRVAPGLQPPLGRFLQLAGRSGTRSCRGWSWGHLDSAPFQPRVRHGTTILAPARWAIPPHLSQAARDHAAWDEALRAWAASARPRPPDIVVTDDADRRIPLDLRRDGDRELLRRLARQGLRAVAEPPGGTGAVQDVVRGPAGNHVLELIIPLARRETRPAAVVPPAPSAQPRSAGQGLFLPGSEWLSLAIRCPAHCQDELIASLAGLAGQHDADFDLWFWIRYATPAHGPHLRARFHGQPVTLAAGLLPALAAWSAGAITRRLSGGFSVEPYEQETERYGGADAVSAAEHVFAADSRLVVTAMTTARNAGSRLLVAALSAADIAGSLADGDPAALGDTHVNRDVRRRLTELRPQARAAWRDPAAGLRVHPAWAQRQTALLAYRDILKPGLRPGCASSVIHMHANRILASDALEPGVRALAADLLRLPS